MTGIQGFRYVFVQIIKMLLISSPVENVFVDFESTNQTYICEEYIRIKKVITIVISLKFQNIPKE